MRTPAALLLALATALSFSCGGGSGSSASDGGAGDASTSGQDGAGGSSGSGSGGGSGGGSGSSGGGSGSGGSSGGSSGGGSSSGGSSGGGARDAGKDSGVPIDPNALYVATTGDDANPGTLAKPFLTLAKAQKAMQASKTQKTTYVRAGTYVAPMTGGNCLWGNSAGSSISLSSADQGETWSYYPPDGVGSAILDGQSTVGNSGGTGGNGVGCAFGASQVSGVKIVGLQMQRYLYSAFWAWEATGVALSDNVIHDTTAASFSAGAIYLIASPGATVSHNLVHDVAYMGIVVADNSAAGDGTSGSTVTGNVVLDACGWPAAPGGNDQDGGDCGGIYFWSQHPSTSTGLRIEGNLVRDVNVSSKGAGDYGSCCVQGIYLDDGTNGVTVTGNVVTGIVSACFHVHGGQGNVFTGNVCDLGTSGATAIVEYQSDGFTQMTGNVFEHNVVVAGSTGAGGGFAGNNSPPTPMTIQNNAYFNYVGASVSSAGAGGAGSDASPTTVDPQLSCWAPSLGKGSPVTKAPVSFPGLAGGWGPPGYALSKTGTAPSWPHGC